MKKTGRIFAAASLCTVLYTSRAVADSPVPLRDDGETDWSVCEEEPVNIPLERLIRILQDHMAMERQESDGREGILMIDGFNIPGPRTPPGQLRRWAVARITAGKSETNAVTYHVLYDRAVSTHCVIPEEVYKKIRQEAERQASLHNSPAPEAAP